MKERELSQKEAREKAEKLLAGAKALFLATNGSHGHPNVRAMAPLKIEGAKTVWFATALESSKIIELVKDDKATLYGYAPRSMTEFRLWGRIQILDDAASRKKIWAEALKKYFPDGAGDSALRVLRFDTISGMYTGKEGKSGTFTI